MHPLLNIHNIVEFIFKVRWKISENDFEKLFSLFPTLHSEPQAACRALQQLGAALQSNYWLSGKFRIFWSFEQFPDTGTTDNTRDATGITSPLSWNKKIDFKLYWRFSHPNKTFDWKLSAGAICQWKNNEPKFHFSLIFVWPSCVNPNNMFKLFQCWSNN